MRRRVMALLAVAVAGTSVVGQAPNREVENVAAFARLYGVVRYFYPSDAAASVDWDRFALHGVQRLRAVPDPARFAAALAELVRPLGPGITIAATLPVAPGVGAADPRLVSWRYLGAGVGGSGRPRIPVAPASWRASARRPAGVLENVSSILGPGPRAPGLCAPGLRRAAHL